MIFGDFSVNDWWAALSAVALLNIIMLAVTVRNFRRSKKRGQENFFALRGWHVLLAGGYVLVCAFRSWLPRADVQRLVMVDHWLSSVFVGRSLATIAELCFVAQWSLILFELARGPRVRWVTVFCRAIVPAIFVAEICSWYAVLTTNFLGNAIEQSIWTATVAVAFVALLVLRRHYGISIRKLLGAGAIMCVLYILFMTNVDIPMYLERWRQDEAVGKAYLSFAEGVRDATTRWYVDRSWDAWREEWAWMTLYFGPTVWFSIALIRAPRFEKDYAKFQKTGGA